MKWTDVFAGPLLAAAAFAAFAAAAEQSCPGGDASCRAPDLDSSSDDSRDDSRDDSSSSDGYANPHSPYSPYSSSSSSSDSIYGGGNPNSHVPEDVDPEDNRATCDEYVDLEGYAHLDETRSFYQEIGWSEGFRGRHILPSKGSKGTVITNDNSPSGLGGNQGTLPHRDPDACMTLDNIVQICDCYRPHYHEPFVHFPAAYLPEFRRVAFIGGGDAMLLHECLKYPNVELVLGLELDQRNVRESLGRFKTQPHFDDPRVQWWFGDAAKSLTLLPRDWFGTFDLVMVDLSETGMSISVNSDLDIFGALALLLKPEGIMVKNEDYFGQMSKYFDYSLSVYMDQNPMVCDQDWAMGSNKADFLKPKLKNGLLEENRVQTLQYMPLDDEDKHYRMILDYAHNDARKQGLCDDQKKEATRDPPVKPAKSPGILLVVDADNATNPLDPAAFRAALKAAGKTPLGASPPPPPGGAAASHLFVGMEEGYVSARSYPGTSSVGLEILLWSGLGGQDDILRALLDAVGVGASYSSYRVIHGGMNGHENWREEADAKGPVMRNTRQCNTEAGGAVDPTAANPGTVDPGTNEGELYAEHFNVVVAESMALLTDKSDKVMAVICGVRGVHECHTLDSLKDDRRVNKVVAIWACPDKGSSAGEEEKEEEEEEEEGGRTLSHVYACGEGVIRRSARSEEGYSALVVDPSAPADLVEAREATFCGDGLLRRGKHPLLRSQVAFVASLAGEAGRSMHARCLRRISGRLVRGATVSVGGAAVGIVASANDGFARRLATVVENVGRSTGLPTRIDRIKSGPVPYQEGFDPVYHSPSAYDRTDAMRQYTRQMPLASQSIYQFEVTNEEETKQLSRSHTKELLDFVIGEYQRFASSERVYFEVGDGSVAVALAPDGHIFVTWNGAALFTVNVLTDGEKYGKLYGGEYEEAPDMVLLDHKAEVADVFMRKLPSSTVVASREQMPRGANRVVNFNFDIHATPGCADYYEFCKGSAEDGNCDNEEHRPWMHQYCALSCGTCDEMIKSLQ